MVAMLGLIMPQPLAAKPRRTMPLGQRDLEGAALACLSVVRMACAEVAAPPAGGQRRARRLVDARLDASPWAAARR